MSQDHFLDLDIKKLFEEHTIKEIELIQKQIQYESDRKKIELRTLVGERYRDLIQAADTIAEMKETSELVVQRIRNIQETFHTLQQKYLIGFKIENDNPIHERKQHEISDSIVLQIKILMEIPENIWTAIDEQNFFLATQLYMLAQHINYCLSIEVGESELALKYPIVSKQWNIINQFKTLIHNFCNDALQSVDLTKELTANCLVALVLLDGLNSSNLLSRLITAKSYTIQSIIISDDKLSVKNRIKLAVQILIETIPLISACFIKHKEHQEGLVSMYIKAIKEAEAISLLTFLDVDTNLVTKVLPSIVISHKPFAQSDIQPLPIEYIQQCISKWFEWVKSFASIEIKKLLTLVKSVKGISKIRDECLKVEIPQDWDLYWETFHLKKINFWMEFFQPLLTQQIKDILQERLTNSFINLKKNIQDLLERLSTSRSCFEIDLRWFIWKDSVSDIPQKLTEVSLLDNKRPLLMKARGFSPNIVKLCEDFEKDLAEILIHLKQYLYEVEEVNPLKDDVLLSDFYLISNKFCDRTEIQEYLQENSRVILNNFIQEINRDFINETPKAGQKTINTVILARFFQAISLLCNNFKECFTLSTLTGVSLTNIKWEEICDSLRQESVTIWSVWAQGFKKIVLQFIEEFLIMHREDEFSTHLIITDWEKVVIDEVADEGKTITSEILVPYQPSVCLQKFLASVCKDLNKIIPHTLPKSVLHEIIENIASEIFNYYTQFPSRENIRQKQAIQILFDVKYISLLMVPRNNKTLTENSNKLSNSIIPKIDPFDFDVFYPFINNNVKKATQRSLLIYGNLVPHMEQLHSILGARLEHSDMRSVKDPPGVLAFSSGTPWFPPLAVTAPAKNLPAPTVTVLTDKPQVSKKPNVKEHNRNDSTGSSIKSGAAAFFGAMGSDWFSSS